MKRRSRAAPSSAAPAQGLDVRQLHYFLRVVERGSLTAAAASLGVTQPTLTKSLRLLEERLGVALLRRLPRGVETTEAGSRLVEHGRSIEVQLADAVREIETLRGGASGVVTIGAGPSWLRRRLPEAVASVIAANPGLAAHVIGGSEDALLRDLRTGQIDMVIAELPPEGSSDDLAVTPLVSDRLVVVARQGHPLAGRRTRLRDLSAYPWIMSPGHSRSRLRLDALFVARNMPQPDIRVETGSVGFLLGVLARTDFLTFTVATTLESADAAGLVALDVRDLRETRAAGVMMRRNAFLSPGARAVIDELRAVCARDPRN